MLFRSNGNSFYKAQIAHRENGECEVQTAHTEEPKMRVYDEDGRFYGIYKWKLEENRYIPVKMFLGT